jgi:hypothetical protein
MQHTDRVAVLATHLAHTDRRALSQAWYSALHLAGDAPSPRAGRGRAPSGATTSRASRSAHAVSCTPARSTDARAQHSAARAASTRPGCVVAETDRRSPKAALALRIERGLRARTPRAGVGSFAVRAAGGRVHIAVRSSGGSTRVVAVCEPALRERVERALAQARFALAGRGVRAEAVR